MRAVIYTLYLIMIVWNLDFPDSEKYVLNVSDRAFTTFTQKTNFTSESANATDSDFYAIQIQDAYFGNYHGLKTLAVSPVVVTNPVTEIRHNSAVANALIIKNSDMPILSCGFIWSTQPMPDLNNNLGGCSGGNCMGEISCTMTDIDLVTVYYVRAYAITPQEIIYGNIVSFISLAAVPIVETFMVNQITFQSAVSGGKVISDGGADITSRGVVWSMTPNPTVENHIGMTDDDTGIGTFISVIKDLQPHTKYYLRAFGLNSASVGYGDQIEFSTPDSPFSLCDAMDNCSFVFSTGGHTRWFGQNETNYDGMNAVRSGYLTHNQESWLETKVEGPGKISFWWKVSSEEYFDFLRFFINGEQRQLISGERDWEMIQYTLGEGTNIIRWTYTKDEFISSGLDRGWLDQLRFTPLDTGTNFGQSGIDESQIYPNPFSQIVTIKNAYDVDRLVFTNLLDQDLLNVTITGSEAETIHTGDLPKGIYLVRVWMKNGNVRIIKMIRE
jgi:hypothetical protein